MSQTLLYSIAILVAKKQNMNILLSILLLTQRRASVSEVNIKFSPINILAEI